VARGAPADFAEEAWHAEFAETAERIVSRGKSGEGPANKQDKE